MCSFGEFVTPHGPCISRFLGVYHTCALVFSSCCVVASLVALHALFWLCCRSSDCQCCGGGRTAFLLTSRNHCLISDTWLFFNAHCIPPFLGRAPPSYCCSESAGQLLNIFLISSVFRIAHLLCVPQPLTPVSLLLHSWCLFCLSSVVFLVSMLYLSCCICAVWSFSLGCFAEPLLRSTSSWQVYV